MIPEKGIAHLAEPTFWIWTAEVYYAAAQALAQSYVHTFPLSSG